MPIKLEPKISEEAVVLARRFLEHYTASVPVAPDVRCQGVIVLAFQWLIETEEEGER